MLGSSLSGVCVKVSFDVKPLTTLDPLAVKGLGGRNSEIDKREPFLDALCDDWEPREDVLEATLDLGDALDALPLRELLRFDLDSVLDLISALCDDSCDADLPLDVVELP